MLTSWSPPIKIEDSVFTDGVVWVPRHLIPVWWCLAFGMPTTQIARVRRLTQKTVENYLSELYEVLGLFQGSARTKAAVIGWHLYDE